MRIYVVTDIHAEPNQAWPFWAAVDPGSPVTRLTLGGLCQRPDLYGEALHHHLFQSGGMIAVQRSLRDIMTEPCVGIGFSAGGTALWQAALAGVPLQAVFCVSSTRLRELPALAMPNHVFFGADDPGRPSQDWIASIPQQASLLDGAGHDFYRDSNAPAAQQVQTALCKALSELEVGC